jgi:hypothetical protein
MLALPLSAAADTPTPFLPLKPQDLLPDMPGAPEGWKMLTSTSMDTFANEWLTTTATRFFKKQPPPAAPGAPPPPPQTMLVSITDTGYKSDFKSVVTPVKGVPPQQNSTYLQIAGEYPARKFKESDTNTLLDYLVKGRFLVEIQSENVSDDDLKKYAEQFNLTKLMAAPDQGDAGPSVPVTVSFVDEMNPKNSRSHQIVWQPAN